MSCSARSQSAVLTYAHTYALCWLVRTLPESGNDMLDCPTCSAAVEPSMPQHLACVSYLTTCELRVTSHGLSSHDLPSPDLPLHVRQFAFALTWTCLSAGLQVTHLFRDVLHGWGQIMLSVNVSPCAKDYDETSHVLKVPHPSHFSCACAATPPTRHECAVQHLTCSIQICQTGT